MALEVGAGTRAVDTMSPILPRYPAIVARASIVALGLLHQEGGGTACAGWWHV